MSFTYQDLKSVNKNSIILDKQETFEIQQNSTGFSQKKSTYIKERFYSKPKNITRSDKYSKTKLGQELANDFSSCDIKVSKHSLFLEKDQEKFKQTTQDFSYKLAKLEENINHEIEELQKESKFLLEKKKKTERKKTRKEKYKTTGHNETWAEQLAGNGCKEQNQQYLALAKEKFSLQHQCICTSPRYGDDKNLTPRPRMRSVGSQITANKECLDQGAVGDHISDSKLHFEKKDKIKDCKSIFNKCLQTDFPIIKPNDHAINCCYGIIDQPLFHYTAHTKTVNGNSCLHHKYQQAGVNANREYNYSCDEYYYNYPNCSCNVQCAHFSNAAATTKHIKRQNTDLDTENFYCRPEGRSYSPESSSGKKYKRKPKGNRSKSKESYEANTERKKREFEKFKEQKNKQQGNKSKEAANETKATTKAEFVKLLSEEENSKIIKHLDRYVDENEGILKLLAPNHFRATQISDDSTTPTAVKLLRTETKLCQVTTQKERHEISYNKKEFIENSDDVSLRSQYSSKALQMLKKMKVHEYKPGKPRRKVDENKNISDTLNENKKQQKLKKYQQYVEIYAKEHQSKKTTEIIKEPPIHFGEHRSEGSSSLEQHTQTSTRSQYFKEIMETIQKSQFYRKYIYDDGEANRRDEVWDDYNEYGEQGNPENSGETSYKDFHANAGHKIPTRDLIPTTDNFEVEAQLKPYQNLVEDHSEYEKDTMSKSKNYAGTYRESKVKDKRTEQQRPKYYDETGRDSMEQRQQPAAPLRDPRYYADKIRDYSDQRKEHLRENHVNKVQGQYEDKIYKELKEKLAMAKPYSPVSYEYESDNLKNGQKVRENVDDKTASIGERQHPIKDLKERSLNQVNNQYDGDNHNGIHNSSFVERQHPIRDLKERSLNKVNNQYDGDNHNGIHNSSFEERQHPIRDLRERNLNQVNNQYDGDNHMGIHNSSFGERQHPIRDLKERSLNQVNNQYDGDNHRGIHNSSFGEREHPIRDLKERSLNKGNNQYDGDNHRGIHNSSFGEDQHPIRDLKEISLNKGNNQYDGDNHNGIHNSSFEERQHPIRDLKERSLNKVNNQYDGDNHNGIHNSSFEERQHPIRDLKERSLNKVNNQYDSDNHNGIHNSSFEERQHPIRDLKERSLNQVNNQYDGDNHNGIHNSSFVERQHPIRDLKERSLNQVNNQYDGDNHNGIHNSSFEERQHPIRDLKERSLNQVNNQYDGDNHNGIHNSSFEERQHPIRDLKERSLNQYDGDNHRGIHNSSFEERQHPIRDLKERSLNKVNNQYDGDNHSGIHRDSLKQRHQIEDLEDHNLNNSHKDRERLEDKTESNNNSIEQIQYPIMDLEERDLNNAKNKSAKKSDWKSPQNNHQQDENNYSQDVDNQFQVVRDFKAKEQHTRQTLDKNNEDRQLRTELVEELGKENIHAPDSQRREKRLTALSLKYEEHKQTEPIASSHPKEKQADYNTIQQEILNSRLSDNRTGHREDLLQYANDTEISEASYPYPPNKEIENLLKETPQDFGKKDITEVENKSHTSSYNDFREIIDHSLGLYSHRSSQTENNFIPELQEQYSFSKAKDPDRISQIHPTTEDALTYLKNFLNSYQQSGMEEQCLHSVTTATNDLITKLSSCKSFLADQVVIPPEVLEEPRKSSQAKSNYTLKEQTIQDTQYKDAESTPDSSDVHVKQQKKREDIFLSTESNKVQLKATEPEDMNKELATNKVQLEATELEDMNKELATNKVQLEATELEDMNKELATNEFFENESYQFRSRTDPQHWQTSETYHRYLECNENRNSSASAEFSREQHSQYESNYDQEYCEYYKESQYHHTAATSRALPSSSRQPVFDPDIMPLKGILKPCRTMKYTQEVACELQTYQHTSVNSFGQKDQITPQGGTLTSYNLGQEMKSQQYNESSEESIRTNQSNYQDCQLETASVLENDPAECYCALYTSEMPEFKQCPCMWDSYVEMITDYYKGKQNIK